MFRVPCSAHNYKATNYRQQSGLWETRSRKIEQALKEVVGLCPLLGIL